MIRFSFAKKFSARPSKSSLQIQFSELFRLTLAKNLSAFVAKDLFVKKSLTSLLNFTGNYSTPFITEFSHLLNIHSFNSNLFMIWHILPAKHWLRLFRIKSIKILCLVPIIIQFVWNFLKCFNVSAFLANHFLYIVIVESVHKVFKIFCLKELRNFSFYHKVN